jgi:hypothetical protein
VKAVEVVLQKYPNPFTAVNPVVLIFATSQDTAPVGPNPVALP